MAAFTSGTYPTGLVANTRPTTTINSDERQAIISLNALLTALSGPLAAMGGEEVPITTGTLSRGTTVTLATAAQVISVNAVSAVVAAQTGQAFGSLGTTTASTVHIGHITVQAGAGGWVAGTSALAGGTGGTPAVATNYYNVDGVADAAASAWATVKQIANQAGTVITSSVG
jgi:hypothetical protein